MKQTLGLLLSLIQLVHSQQWFLSVWASIEDVQYDGSICMLVVKGCCLQIAPGTAKSEQLHACHMTAEANGDLDTCSSCHARSAASRVHSTQS